MVFDWLDEQKTPGLTREERLMGVLFHLGMATNRQLEIITGWSKTKLSDARQGIRNKGKHKTSQYEEQLLKQIENSIGKNETFTENQLIWIRNSLRALARKEEQKDDWLRMYGSKKTNGVYTLGAEAVRYVADMMGGNMIFRELGAGQREHAVGITEILVRLIQAGTKPEQWLSSREASDRIANIQEKWKIENNNGEWEVEKGKQGRTIRPDGAVKINGQWFYIEYDRGTKHGERIRKQIDDYILLAGKVEIDPIIWVTGHKERTKDLRDRIYPEVMKKYPPEYPAPKMFFFTEGEETDFLINSEPLVFPKEQAEDEKLQLQEEKLQELEMRIEELEMQLEEKQMQLEEERIKTSRQEEQISRLFDLANRNRDDKERILSWSRGLVEHLKESKGGFFKPSPEQVLLEYVEERGYPDELKEEIAKEEDSSSHPLSRHY